MGTEEDHKKRESAWSVHRSKFEPRTSELKSEALPTSSVVPPLDRQFCYIHFNIIIPGLRSSGM